MTNEELALLCQKSDNKEFLPLLWNKVKGFCFSYSDDYFRTNADSFSACGQTFEDCRQQCYFGFLQAVKTFHEDCGYSFVTHLKFPLKNCLRELLGIRNGTPNKQPLDNADSLNVEINNEGESELTPLDLLEDTTALESYENVLQSVSDEETRKVLSNAINRLKPPLQAVIYCFYFENMTLSQIAEKENVSLQMISTRHKQALNQLRRTPEVRMLWAEMHEEKYLHSQTKQFTYEDYQREKQVSEVLRRGSLLTEKQRQKILFDCQLEKSDNDYLLALAHTQK